PRRAHPSPEAALAGAIRDYGEPTAHWVYRDARGAEVMRVYRFDPTGRGKQYRPIHPTPEGWVVGDPPGSLGIYNLDRLAAEPSARVWLKEGEKCCDLAGGLGLLSTTSSHGARSAGRTDWTPLAGRDVVLLPDNDEAGERYA